MWQNAYMMQTLDTATFAAALDALIAYDARAVYKALSIRREALRRRYEIQCSGCGVTIPNAHDRQMFCSTSCRRRATYLRRKELREERIQAVADYRARRQREGRRY